MSPWSVQSGAKLCEAGLKYLDQRPVHHELLLGLAQAQRDPGSSAGPCPSGIWRSVWSGGEPAGLLFQSDRGLVSFSMMPFQAVGPLCAALVASASTLQTVHAPAELGAALSSELAMGEQAQSRFLMVARRVQAQSSAGRMELARIADLPWVHRSCEAMCREQGSEPLAGSRLERWLQQGRVYLWQDGQQDAVALAIQSRERGRGACIAFVYTWPHLRGRGYAGALTSALSQRLLERDFDYLWLHALPSLARGFYAQLGFEALLEFCSWRVHPKG